MTFFCRQFLRKIPGGIFGPANEKILFDVMKSDKEDEQKRYTQDCGSGSGKKSRIRIQESQICQKLFIFEQTFNKFHGENRIANPDPGGSGIFSAPGSGSGSVKNILGRIRENIFRIRNSASGLGNLS